jgi:hypothetical protein
MYANALVEGLENGFREWDKTREERRNKNKIIDIEITPIS